MPGKTYGEEVVIVVIIAIITFLVVISLMTFIIIFYQKKRFLHQQQLAEKDKEYSQQLLQSQIEIQEQTFSTISNEIHDNVGQVLSLAKVQLNIIDQQSVLDKAILADAKESVSKAMADLRDIAKSLNSDRIRRIDLYEITAHELQRINRSGFMNTSIDKSGNVTDIDERKKMIIFRIMQESLQNIIKHSSASTIGVLFQYKNDRIEISIVDNGKGFDQLLVDKQGGMGLQNILNRAKLIGGYANIESVPGCGTRINIISPYE